jgi:siroheme synthase
VAVLDFARREARKLMIGHSAPAGSARDEIDALTIKLVRQHKRVVRLVSAAVLASERETITSFRRRGIPIDVVSGMGWVAESEAAAADEQTAPKKSATGQRT